MSIRYKYNGTSGNTNREIDTGINFTSDEVTNAPVSKVYLNDRLIWQPTYKVIINYSAYVLDRLKIYTLDIGADKPREENWSLGNSNSHVVKCTEGQLLLITPVAKSGYVVTSHHDKFITVTGDITINVTTKTATKGKLNPPVLIRGGSGMVDGDYKAYGTFQNTNSVSVTATTRPYYIENRQLYQTRDMWDRTDTFTAGSTQAVEVGGQGFYPYKGMHLLAVKFSADGYEDSEWRFWSDYTSLVNSTAYTTGQIPLALYEECAYYEDGDKDGDYDIFIDLEPTSHPLKWPMTVFSPLGATEYNMASDITLYDVPPDNLKIKVMCYDPKGLFKSANISVTNSDLSEAPNSI